MANTIDPISKKLIEAITCNIRIHDIARTKSYVFEFEEKTPMVLNYVDEAVTGLIDDQEVIDALGPAISTEAEFWITDDRSVGEIPCRVWRTAGGIGYDARQND